MDNSSCQPSFHSFGSVSYREFSFGSVTLLSLLNIIFKCFSGLILTNNQTLFVTLHLLQQVYEDARVKKFNNPTETYKMYFLDM